MFHSLVFFTCSIYISCSELHGAFVLIFWVRTHHSHTNITFPRFPWWHIQGQTITVVSIQKQSPQLAWATSSEKCRQTHTYFSFLVAITAEILSCGVLLFCRSDAASHLKHLHLSGWPWEFSSPCTALHQTCSPAWPCSLSRAPVVCWCPLPKSIQWGCIILPLGGIMSSCSARWTLSLM